MQHACPECSSDDCERVRPEGLIERMAPLLGWHVYRCLECHEHFYDRSLRHKRLMAASRELLELGKADLKAAGERLDRACHLQRSRLLRTLRKRRLRFIRRSTQVRTDPERERFLALLMSADSRLVDGIRQHLDAGTLPRAHIDKIWAGISSGDETCSACGDPISPARVIYEGDVADVTYRFHAGCYGLWVGELILRGLY